MKPSVLRRVGVWVVVAMLYLVPLLAFWLGFAPPWCSAEAFYRWMYDSDYFIRFAFYACSIMLVMIFAMLFDASIAVPVSRYLKSRYLKPTQPELMSDSLFSSPPGSLGVAILYSVETQIVTDPFFLESKLIFALTLFQSFLDLGLFTHRVSPSRLLADIIITIYYILYLFITVRIELTYDGYSGWAAPEAIWITPETDGGGAWQWLVVSAGFPAFLLLLHLAGPIPIQMETFIALFLAISLHTFVAALKSPHNAPPNWLEIHTKLYALLLTLFPIILLLHATAVCWGPQYFI